MTELARYDWMKDAASIRFRDKAFINGKPVEALSGETFDCINPATGDVIARVAACGEADVDRAVKAARAAFEDGRWSGKAPAERKAVLLKLADLIRENRTEEK